MTFPSLENKLAFLLLTLVIGMCSAWAASVDRAVKDLGEHQHLTDSAVIQINTKLDMLLLLQKAR